MSSPQTQRTINRWAGRAIPLILTGIVGYATWVVVVEVCVHYLLHPPRSLGIDSRPGAAIAIIVLYFLLLPLFTIPYLRVLQIIIFNPGYIEQRKKPDAERTSQEKPKKEEQKFQRSCASTTVPEASSQGRPAETARPGHARNISGLDRNAIFNGSTAPPTGLAHFYSKEVFVCDYQGLPIWCTTCHSWKPDRTHHCSEVGRCVRRMDHFCPWVGGIVSENNMKFFIQFVSFASIYNLFVTIVMAYFVAEKIRNKADNDSLDTNWIVVLALGALFFLISLGMAGSSIQLTSQNLTTVENLTKHNRVCYLAVLVNRTGQQIPPPPPVEHSHPQSTHASEPSPYLHSITYPLQSELTTTPRPPQSPSSAYPTNPRTFAILRTNPGDNPWDLGSPLANLKTVMGNRWYDWILPIRYSPHCNHDRGDSDFPLGPAVERLKREAGLVPPLESERRSGSRRRRRRRRGEMRGSGGREAEGEESGSAPEGAVEGRRRQKRRRRRRDDGPVATDPL